MNTETNTLTPEPKPQFLPPPGYEQQNPEYRINLEGLVNGMTIIGECR